MKLLYKCWARWDEFEEEIELNITDEEYKEREKSGSLPWDLNTELDIQAQEFAEVWRSIKKI